MIIHAEFCVSHGDQMKIAGISIQPFIVDAQFLEWTYQQISRRMGRDMLKEQAEGRLGEHAHLVTHPDDR